MDARNTLGQDLIVHVDRRMRLYEQLAAAALGGMMTRPEALKMRPEVAARIVLEMADAVFREVTIGGREAR